MSLESGTLLVGRYRIGQVLGKGGFGAVYLATDESLGLPCAVKENISVSPETERQFRREANLLANLRHPNLPRVTNHFVLADQQYLVMDFVEGEDLKHLLAQAGPLPAADVLKWAGQICDALTYLHRRIPPVIHRDIKPANIKLAASGDAMLVDFGIAKASAPGQQTTTSAMGLTPGFAPPEQYGMGGTDQRSDEYAFAATLYTLLSAKTPPDSMERLLGNDTLKPLANLRPDLAPHVAAAVMRALSIQPDQRFQMVADFKAALMGQVPLEEILAGQETAPAETEPAGYAAGVTEAAATRRSPAETQAAGTRAAQPRRRSSGTLAAVLVGGVALGVLALMAWLGLPVLTSLLAPATSVPLVLPTATISIATDTAAPPTVAASATLPAPSPTPTVAENTPTPSSTPPAPATATETPTSGPTLAPTVALTPISASNVLGLARLKTLGASGRADFALSPDGKQVALTTSQGIDIVDVASGARVKHLNAFWGTKRVVAVAFLPDSLLIQSPDVINRWDFNSGNFLPNYGLTGHTLFVSANSQRMVVPHDKYGQVVDIASHALLFTQGNPDSDYQFSPDGAYLAWADLGGGMGKLNLVHWVNVATKEEKMLAGNGKPLGALAVSPDGKWLISASGDIWETATGNLSAPFDSSANFVAVSADSQMILGNDGEVYAIATGKEIGRLSNALNPTRLAFTPDGTRLIVQSGENVEVWAATQPVAQTTAVPTATPSSPATPAADAISISNTARLVLRGWWGNDGLLSARLIHDAASNAANPPVAVWGGAYKHIAFSPDGRHFAGVNSGGVDIVDVATHQVVDHLDGPTFATEAVFLTDKFILVADTMKVERWELETHKLKQTYPIAGHSLIGSPDGQRFALQDDRFVYVVDVVTGKAPQASSDPNCDFLFTPDGRYLASTIGINVALWDVTTQKPTVLPGKLGVKTAGLAFSPDGKELFSATGDIWDWNAGKPLGKFAGGAGRIAISPDGRLIVGDTGALFDGVTGQLIGSLLDVRGPADAVAFSPDGSQLLWHTAQGAVYVWGVGEGGAIPTPAAPAADAISPANAASLTLQARWGKGKLYSAQWSPDEKYLAVNTSLNTIIYQGDTLAPVQTLWGSTTLAVDAANRAVVVDSANLKLVEVTTGRELLSKPMPGVTAAAFSPDGNTLALAGQVTTTGKADGVALLNLSDGSLKMLSQGWGTSKVVLGAAFSPDGKYLAVSFRGVAWVWDVASGKQARPPIANVALPAQFSPDGQYLAYFTDHKMIIERVLTGYQMLSTNLDGTPYFPASRDIDPFVPVSHAFMADGRLLVIYQTLRGHQVTLARWEPKATTVPEQLLNNLIGLDSLRGSYAGGYDSDRAHTIPMLALSSAGKKFYSLTADGVVRVWSFDSGQQLAATVPDYLEKMALSPDGRTVALANGMGGVDLLDLASGKVSKTISGAWYPKAMIYNSPSVLLMLYPGGEEGDHLAALDLTQGAVIGGDDNPSKYYTDSRDFSMSRDGRLLALWTVVNYQDVLGLFTLAPAQPLFTLNKLNGAEYTTAFSPDGQYLARANRNKVEFWNIQSRQMEPDKTLTGKHNSFGNLVFSADGQRLISASGDVWDLASHKSLINLPSKATRVALDPDGQVLVGNDGSVWNVSTGQLLGTLNGALGPASHLAFTPDGRQLVWQTKEGVVEVWGVKP